MGDAIGFKIKSNDVIVIGGYVFEPHITGVISKRISERLFVAKWREHLQAYDHEFPYVVTGKKITYNFRRGEG